jgi:hypothetical protein
VLDLKSFALTGNIKRRADMTPLSGIEVKEMLDGFFLSETANLDPAPGAADALARLNQLADIVILSNIPLAQRADRIAALDRCGMAYPVIANSGHKGPAVAALCGDLSAPIVFLDDLPPNLQSVADHAPHVHRLHMIADKRLRRMIPASPIAHARHDDWADALPYIIGLLTPP